MDRHLIGHRGVILIGMGIILCAFFVSYTPLGGFGTAGAEAKNPFEGDAAAIPEGEELFSDYCSECHGSGSGGRGPNLIDREWKYGGSDSEVFESIADGRPGGMSAMMLDMGEEEIWKVIAYLRSIEEK